MYLHVEGLDLAGKSTVCRRLQDRIPAAKIRRNSLIESNPMYEAADVIRQQDSIQDEILGMLFYGALRVDLDSYAPPEGNVIQESTILLRSIVFHASAGNTALARLFEAKLGEHPRFDASFVLTCSRDKRLERLKGRISRGNDAPDDLIVRDDWKRFFSMENHLIDLAQQYFNATIIHTDELETPTGSDQVLDKIIMTAKDCYTNPVRSDIWQNAVTLAACCHKSQWRKDGKTPYISHPMRVALVLSNLFHVSDPVVVSAALLHDVLEDTDCDYDDIEKQCGNDVAALVAGLTKDSRLPESIREKSYEKQMENADWRVRLIKAADIYDNMWDMKHCGVKVNARRWADWLLPFVADDDRFVLPIMYIKKILED